MRNVVLRPGSSGPFVRDMQLALNSRLNPSPNLIVNGVMTAQTELAVRAFQRANWLEEDGIAGPGTLDALYNTEAAAPILHNVTYVSQPTATTCWAAATAMLKNATVGVIQMGTPQRLLNLQGSLINESERGQRLAVHTAFALIHGLTYRPPQSWPVSSLISMLQRGPVMMELLWRPGSYRQGNGSAGHYVVVVGTRGSHAADGNSTTLRIYDPLPVNQRGGQGGGIYSVTYAAMLHRMPLATFGVFTR